MVSENQVIHLEAPLRLQKNPGSKAINSLKINQKNIIKTNIVLDLSEPPPLATITWIMRVSRV